MFTWTISGKDESSRLYRINSFRNKTKVDPSISKLFG